MSYVKLMRNTMCDRKQFSLSALARRAKVYFPLPQITPSSGLSRFCSGCQETPPGHDFFKSEGNTLTDTDLHQPLKFWTPPPPLIPPLDTPLPHYTPLMTTLHYTVFALCGLCRQLSLYTKYFSTVALLISY